MLSTNYQSRLMLMKFFKKTKTKKKRISLIGTENKTKKQGDRRYEKLSYSSIKQYFKPMHHSVKWLQMHFFFKFRLVNINNLDFCLTNKI